METQALDFSDLGARPVPQPGQAGGQLDFSDLGGRRVSAPTKAATQPSLGEVLTQPTDKTDKEYLGYTGPAGVAGATIHGMSNVARGVGGALQGIYETGKDIVQNPDRPLLIPNTEGKYKDQETIIQKYNPFKGASEIPGAIRDINASADPINSYLDAGQDTAAQGAGQALTALGTEGLARAMAHVGPPVVRLAARSAETAANQKLVPIRPILNINTPADEAAAVHFKVPGRDFGITKPVYPGAHLPENPGMFPGAPYPANPPSEYSQAGALSRLPRTGALPASQTGEALRQAPTRLADQIKTPALSPPTINVTGRMPYPPGRNIDLSPGMETPGGAVVAPRVRGLLPSAPEDPALPRLVDQIKTPASPRANATLIEQMGGKPVETITQSTSRLQLRPPVTKNPVVGNFARAMQKSGVPMTDRPSLLLKGSGRVNRILGPEEELTDALAKSVRLAKRMRGK